MKVLADESVEGRIVEFLRDQGHDVLYVTETAPGTPDPQVLEMANREQRILVTNDKDFGELTFMRGEVSAGIVLVRTQSESAEENQGQSPISRKTRDSHLFLYFCSPFARRRQIGDCPWVYGVHKK